MAVVINIIAAVSKTGKTTLIEKLVPELMVKGLRVAVLKGNSKKYALDIPGKDTWRYIDAGAMASGMVTADKYILIGRAPDQVKARESIINILRDMDIILIEGDKMSEYPKIEVIREKIGTKLTNSSNVIAIATDLQESDTDIPVFDLNKPAELAAFIFNRFFVEAEHLEIIEDKKELTHFDGSGRPRMVDVTAKDSTVREAYAKGDISLNPDTLSRIKEGTIAKGDVLGVAQVAAIMAVKETGRLIPMAHPLGVSSVEADFEFNEDKNLITAGVRVKLTGQTGVEMEALTGVSMALLTIYDMCKAIDKEMVVGNIRLEEKKGGRSGHYRRKN